MAEPSKRCSALRCAVVVGVLLAVGCMSSAPVRQTTHQIAAQMPGCALETEEHIVLGPVTLAFVRLLASWAGDEIDAETRALLDDLRRVEVRSFTLEAQDREAAGVRLAAVEQSLAHAGFSPVVRSRERGESTSVLVREDRKGQIDALMVVSLDQRELEIVHLEGRLDRLLAEQIAADPDALAFLKGS